MYSEIKRLLPAVALAMALCCGWSASANPDTETIRNTLKNEPDPRRADPILQPIVRRVLDNNDGGFKTMSDVFVSEDGQPGVYDLINLISKTNRAKAERLYVALLMSHNPLGNETKQALADALHGLTHQCGDVELLDTALRGDDAQFARSIAMAFEKSQTSRVVRFAQKCITDDSVLVKDSKNPAANSGDARQEMAFSQAHEELFTLLVELDSPSLDGGLRSFLREGIQAVDEGEVNGAIDVLSRHNDGAAAKDILSAAQCADLQPQTRICALEGLARVGTPEQAMQGMRNVDSVTKELSETEGGHTDDEARLKKAVGALQRVVSAGSVSTTDSADRK